MLEFFHVAFVSPDYAFSILKKKFREFLVQTCLRVRVSHFFRPEPAAVDICTAVCWFGIATFMVDRTYVDLKR